MLRSLSLLPGGISSCRSSGEVDPLLALPLLLLLGLAVVASAAGRFRRVVPVFRVLVRRGSCLGRILAPVPQRPAAVATAWLAPLASLPQVGGCVQFACGRLSESYKYTS